MMRGGVCRWCCGVLQVQRYAVGWCCEVALWSGAIILFIKVVFCRGAPGLCEWCC